MQTLLCTDVMAGFALFVGELCSVKPNRFCFRLFVLFLFFDSTDLRVASGLVLRRTGSIMLPLGVVRSCRVSLP